jgi:hypothetical protein
VQPAVAVGQRVAAPEAGSGARPAAWVSSYTSAGCRERHYPVAAPAAGSRKSESVGKEL